MGYFVGEIVGTIFRVYLLTRLTGYICRKIGVKDRYLLKSTYSLYILLFWPLAFIINSTERALDFVVLDIPVLVVFYIIDAYRKKKNKKSKFDSQEEYKGGYIDV